MPDAYGENNMENFNQFLIYFMVYTSAILLFYILKKYPHCNKYNKRVGLLYIIGFSLMILQYLPRLFYGAIFVMGLIDDYLYEIYYPDEMTRIRYYLEESFKFIIPFLLSIAIILDIKYRRKRKRREE